MKDLPGWHNVRPDPQDEVEDTSSPTDEEEFAAEMRYLKARKRIEERETSHREAEQAVITALIDIGSGLNKEPWDG